MPGGLFGPKSQMNPPEPRFINGIASPYLKIFRPSQPNGRSLLVIPGGAYIVHSILNEGVDIAREMTSRGYTVYVLISRLPREGWSPRADVPLMDAQRAMRVVRAAARVDGRDPAKVACVGFSASGHLAASLATQHAEAVYRPLDAADELSARPDASGLDYPVISSTPGIGHALSFAMLLGEAPDAATLRKRSTDLQVSSQTPSVFLAHSIDDGDVPIENSLLMLAELCAAGRPAEAHFFERGGHGYGLGNPASSESGWIAMFSRWLDQTLTGLKGW